MQSWFARFSHAVLRGSLLTLGIVVPAIYFPWTYEPLEINKQTVTVVLVGAAGLAWLGATISERRLIVRREWLLAVIALMIVAALVSPGLGSAPYVSLVGQAGQEYVSVLSMVAFGLMVFLAPFAFEGHATQRRLFSGVIVVGTLAAVMTLPGYFGYPVLNLVGTPNTLVLYLLAVSVLGCALWLSSRDAGPHDVLPHGAWGTVLRVCIALSTLSTLIGLMAIDYVMLWILVIVGTGTMLAFALVRAHEFPHFGRFLLPMALLVGALVFLFLPPVIRNPFPPEVTPSHSASFSIASQTLIDGHAALFGSGTGTYAFDYARFVDRSLNETDFWDIRFDRASSHLLTLLPTMGVVGTALYLVLLVGVASVTLLRLARERAHEAWKLTFAPFVAWLVLAVGQCVYSSNFTLQVLFWLLTAVLLAQAVRAVKVYDFTRSPRAGIASAFVCVFMLVGLVMTLFVSMTRYAAEVAFAKSVSIDRAGGSLDEVITLLDRAAVRNRWSDVYRRNLGYAMLLRTQELLNDTTADPAMVQSFIATSVNAAKDAVRLAPGNVVNWELLGDVYREITPLFTDVDLAAIAAYEKAVALSPNNPEEYVGLARAQMARADRLAILAEGEDAAAAETAASDRVTALAAAEAALSTAQELKSDYTPALYYLAHVYERQDRLSDAVKSMESLRASAPMDVGVAMQLGLLYLKQGKNDFAKQELSRALRIAPNYANAHWYLASIYEQEGDLPAAIAAVEAIEAIDPDNALVAQRLERLAQGFAESQLPEPIEEGDATATDGDGSTEAQTEE